ncbi:MAG: hypothetical protein HYT62_01585 [Candidatus Yanofskybacteria bacterium]|nr:hypothetical protein [Candidatus Yanofskybacteria bacterium]
MDNNFMENIQRRVMGLLLTRSGNLQVAARDQCSEVARIVGCWILDEYPEHGVQICKGTFSDESSHDILIIDDGKLLFLVDPTIWQKFPESENIFVGSVNDMPGAVSFLEEKYGGTWKLSEIMQKCDENYQQELLDIIKKN